MSYIIPTPPALPCQCSLQDWMRYFEQLKQWWSRHLTSEFNWDAVRQRAQQEIAKAFKLLPREMQPQVTAMLKRI